MFCLLARDNQHISLIPDFLPTENINIKTPSDQFTGPTLCSIVSATPLSIQVSLDPAIGRSITMARFSPPPLLMVLKTGHW